MLLFEAKRIESGPIVEHHLISIEDNNATSVQRMIYASPKREREGNNVIIKLLPLSLSPLSVTHKSSIRMSTTQIPLPSSLSLSLLAYKMIEVILT